MFIEVLLISLVIILAISLIFSGAPYLPTRTKQADMAIKLLNLKKGELVVDLGSGDGEFLLSASKHDLRVVGVEINPILVLISKARTIRHKNIKVVWANMWKFKLPDDTKAVYIFLLDRYMKKMDEHLSNQLTELKVASYAFKFPNRQPIKQKGPTSIYQF